MPDSPLRTTDGARRTRPRFWGVRIVLGVQMYTLAAYVSAIVLTQLWYPALSPLWIWYIAALALAGPGLFITLGGPAVGYVLALVGATVLIKHYRALPKSLRWWCISGTVLMGAYALYSLTPLAHTVGNRMMN